MRESWRKLGNFLDVVGKNGMSSMSCKKFIVKCFVLLST